LKLDVQGSELPALRGARTTIARERMPILFEFEPLFCEDFEISFSDYADFVSDVDYSFVRRIQLDSDNFLICPRQGVWSDWRGRMIRAAVPYRNAAKARVRAFLNEHPAMVHVLKTAAKPLKPLFRGPT